jgi:hypothetical protein
VLALKASWQLLRSSSEHLWIGLIAIQYIVSAQFSGAIYNSTALWVLIPLVLNLPVRKYLFDEIIQRRKIKSAVNVSGYPRRETE